MKADAQTEAQVADVLARLLASLSDRDADAFMSLWAPDPDVVLVPAEGEEARTGLREIRALRERDIAQSESMSIELQWRRISVTGSLAWIAAEAVGHTTVGCNELTLPLRFTGVLERRDATWLFQQLHWSTPAVTQAADASFPTSLDAVTSVVEQERVDLCNCAAPDGTVTLLFTDIENSTPMAEELGDLRWIDVLREHNAIVRECIALHGGSEVKTIGDAFMVAFGSARRALLCAIDIQRAVSAYCEGTPNNRWVCVSACIRSSRCGKVTTSTERAWSSRRASQVKRTAARSWCRRCYARSPRVPATSVSTTDVRPRSRG